MPVHVKICGLSTPETLDAAIKGGASHVGLMFFPASPRAVDLTQAAGLASRAPAHVVKVGVFVDPDDTMIDAAIAAARLDAIQLHRTSPQRTAAIRARAPIEIWAAIGVRTMADLRAAATYRDAADRVLYDAKAEENAAVPGGQGVRFDWGLLEGFAHPLPWVLAGGLVADNLRDAVGATGASTIDVSSGVESAPGVKDVDKIAAFLKAAASL